MPCCRLRGMSKLLAAYAGAAVVVVLLAAGCAARPVVPGVPADGATAAGTVSPGAAASGTSPAGAPSGTPAGTAEPATIVGTVFRNPYLTSTASGLYLRWALRSSQLSQSPEGVARVDPANGEILAANVAIPGPMSAPAYGDGSLWVTDSVGGSEHLLRLNPQNLAVTGEVEITGGNARYQVAYGGDSHIAFAGGFVWADGADRLAAVDPATMAVRRAITFTSMNHFGGSIESDATASSDGKTLVVSEANSGVGTLQRRDPVTGALLASVPSTGTIAPVLDGIVSGGLWISVPTGMMGAAVLLNVATLTRASSGFSATSVAGSNGIRANLWDGELWVTDLGGGPQRNYCADPDTGRRRATSPLPDLAVDEPMTVAGRREYYGVPSGDGFEIRWVPVPAACA